MTYIYDILLNFNDDFYEFYEWEKGDYIYHVKKIPIIKIDTNLMELLFSKKIKFTKELGNMIYSKVDLFGNRKYKLKYCCLFTDGYKVLGVLLNDNLEVNKLSDLLLDEASDTINISNRSNIVELEYNIIGNNKYNYLLTRYENNIKKYLEEELKNIYKNKEDSKLKYIYYEYFNNNIDNIDEAYKELKNSLKLEVTDKHINLYNLLHLKEECKNMKMGG